jgi:hypothetical protein
MSLFHLHENRSDPSAGRASAYFSQLFITTGYSYFRYTMLDSENNEFIALSNYQAAVPIPNPESWSAATEDLVTTDEFLFRKYPTIIAAADTLWHSVIPATFHEPDGIRNHLQLNFSLPENLRFYADRLPELNAWNAWAIEPGIDDALRRHFPQCVLLHATTPLLRWIALSMKQSQPGNRMFLHFDRQKFDIAIFADNQLQFFNSFSFENVEDILYYTLYSAEQLKIRPSEIDLQLCGDIDTGSDAAGLLREYLASVGSFGRPESFSYSPLFDFPVNRYTALFALGLCGS